MKLKYIIAFALLMQIFATQSFAVPVLNESTANNNYIIVFPDNKDPNLYYLGTNFMTIKNDERGVPLFSYTEYYSGFEKFAIIQTIMYAHYYDEIRGQVTKDILKQNPKAKFTTLPFAESKIDFAHTMGDLIEEEACGEKAGQINDEMNCAFRLNRKGIRYFRAQMQKNLVFAVNFIYSVNGCLRNGANDCVPTTQTHSVAARLTSDLIKTHPELFLDHRGRVIDFNIKK